MAAPQQERVAGAGAAAAESSAGLPPPQDVGYEQDPESWRTSALQGRLDKLVEERKAREAALDQKVHQTQELLTKQLDSMGAPLQPTSGLVLAGEA